MDSDRIKAIVAKAQLVLSCYDIAFDDVANQEADELLEMLLKFAGKSQTFSVAVVCHLQDQGFKILDRDNDVTDRFRAKFSKALALDERSMTAIKTIAARLFR